MTGVAASWNFNENMIHPFKKKKNHSIQFNLIHPSYNHNMRNILAKKKKSNGKKHNDANYSSTAFE